MIALLYIPFNVLQTVIEFFNSLMIQRILTPTFSFFLLLLSKMIFLKLCQCLNLTLPLACWQMAQMTQITQMCSGDRKCALVCAGAHRCARVCTGVRVYTSVRCCARLYLGVRKCAQVCMCVCKCV